ncbi:MAG TPA: PD-(D/E)XK nuclease family protein [Methylomirabilota bacterium]|nr:PD-(D/E)XK nuclease family protein [Methylomirabilota bacterium]
MQVRLLLGPAGSGKTFRCLEEARRELAARPAGPLLLFVAPKQTTFQLERQLLSDSTLPGYTRLQILSFERLAYFLFDHLRKSAPDLLAEEGRVMVLRALLAGQREHLKVFRASARLTGFAQQLGELLAELQRNQLSPAALQDLAGRLRAPEGLGSKLEDLAGLLQDYVNWLEAHKLQDAERLLAAAGALLLSPPASAPAIDHLWVDGFAEWSPQEWDLLMLLLPGCRQATFTFCLDRVPSEKISWLSAWSVVRKNFEECRKRLEKLPGVSVNTELVPRDPQHSRFAQSLALQYLERNWDAPPPRQPAALPLTPRPTTRRRRSRPSSSLQLELPGWGAWEGGPLSAQDTDKAPTEGPEAPPPAASVEKSLRVVRCADPEAEATIAAREILACVRAGGRYRDIAVLVRKLDLYHDCVQRIFTRYQIPYFMDQRETVAHHPLAELTRSALRTLLTHWKHEDWFAALKTGLVPSEESEIDELENEALARGWKGKDWHEPLRVAAQPGSRESAELLQQMEERLEALRKRLLPPFQKLALTLGRVQNKPTGSQLADAVQDFWASLDIETQLENWTESDRQSPDSQNPASVHLTVWEQMNEWLENLRLAFPNEALPLREWLPILEAGLSSLTVGAIPPALDQVLIGSIDRSRNQEIKLVLVLGLNESVFPAAPEPLPLLTDADRAQLEENDLLLASSPRRCLSRERFYAYIAFTRARDRVVLTSAQYDTTGTPLNPSPFLGRIRELFPSLEFETEPRASDWRLSEHSSELIAPLLALQRSTPTLATAETGRGDWQQLARLPELQFALDRLHQVRGAHAREELSPELARALYGSVLRTSVSRLEEFAACPFKFFVNSGLRAEERKQFELDAREQGSFQHEVLAEFHRQLRRENKRWRDITPKEARERIGAIANLLMAGYRDGLLQATEESRFLARVLTNSLEDFIETLVGWMERQYEFDPLEVELPFGYSDLAPAWQLDLGDGTTLAVHGRIDRIDVWRREGQSEAWCLVVDYKSRVKQLDPILVANGLQLQLLTYLNVLRDWPNPGHFFQADRLIPAGVFYVNLRGKYERSQNRVEALKEIHTQRKNAYKHLGRFDIRALPMLDARPGAREGDQFNFRLTNAGQPYKTCRDVLSPGDFASLLESVEAHLKRMGREILSGIATVDPYRKGGVTACDQCTYQAICRIDPWTQSFRVLRKPKEDSE